MTKAAVEIPFSKEMLGKIGIDGHFGEKQNEKRYYDIFFVLLSITEVSDKFRRNLK